MNTEICLVFNENCPNDHSRWLPKIREWISANSPLFYKLGLNLKHNIISLDRATSWRPELTSERVVVAVGYKVAEIEGLRSCLATRANSLIVVDNSAPNIDPAGSASFAEDERIICSHDATGQLRKSLIRIALRKQVTIRSPETEEEFAQYFSLRYRVWNSAGYLRDENRRARTPWEIDVWDRMSIPIVAVAPNRGVVGCARLINKLGAEMQPFSTSIEAILEKKADPELWTLFSYQKQLSQPFDVLVQFPAFRARFRQLLKNRSSIAEIGRVAVGEEFRHGFLAEALVDTALSHAAARNFCTVILACPERLSELYRRCGFERSPGPTANSFFNINVASIMMERQVACA